MKESRIGRLSLGRPIRTGFGQDSTSCGIPISGPFSEDLDVPGLVLAARQDPLVPPKVSENLCGLTREGAIAWHEEGAHALHATDPVWCAEAIEDFLQ